MGRRPSPTSKGITNGPNPETKRNLIDTSNKKKIKKTWPLTAGQKKKRVKEKKKDRIGTKGLFNKGKRGKTDSN